MGTYTQKRTHKNIPLLLGRQPLAPLQPLGQQMCIVLPPTGTCCRNLLLCHVQSEQNLTISQMLHEIGFYFFEEPPNTKKTKHILSLQFSQSQHIVNTFIGTFSVVQGLSKVQEMISGKTGQQCNYCMNCHDILYGHPWSQEDEAF